MENETDTVAQRNDERAGERTREPAVVYPSLPPHDRTEAIELVLLQETVAILVQVEELR